MSVNATNATHEGIIEALQGALPMILRYVAAALVFVVGVVIALIARRVAAKSILRGLSRDVANVVEKLIYYSIVAIAGISALAVAGVEATGLVVAGSIAGVALGFASQTVISNFLSGIFLYIDRPFKPGDPVDIEGIGGVVTDVTIFSTRVRTWDGVHTRLPNSKVFEAVIKNFVSNVARRVEYKVGISYSSDIDEAIRVIRRVLDRHPLVLAEPEPMIFVEELGDSAVVLNVRFWAPAQAWFQAKAELLKLIKQALDEAGIEIPFPQRVVWLRDVTGRICVEPGGGSGGAPRGKDSGGGSILDAKKVEQTKDS